MTANKKKNRTNRTRAARTLSGLEPDLTYTQALHLLRTLVAAGSPVPDVTDAGVRTDLLTRWAATRPAPTGAGYAYLACYDGYTLGVVATDGPVHVHDLGSVEDDPDTLTGLPATAATGELWVWFENETYAADCYRSGPGVHVVSYDWSLLVADLRSRFADVAHATDRFQTAHADVSRLTPVAPTVAAALLEDAYTAAVRVAETGGTPQVTVEAAQWAARFAEMDPDPAP